MMEKISYPLEKNNRKTYGFEIAYRVKIDEELFNLLVEHHKKKYHKGDYFQKTNKIAYLVSESDEDTKIYAYQHDFWYYILTICFDITI
ncbi:MAG: hypothetical protein ACOCWW_01090 [Bacteroidota bacterium]